MARRVRRERVTTEELDEPWVYWRSGYGWGALSIGFLIWAAASGLLDALWRAVWGG